MLTSYLASARREEKRNKFRLTLVRKALEGNWHCSSNKKGKHQPDRLTEFMRRARNFDKAALSDTLRALTQPKFSSWQPEDESEELLARTDDQWLDAGLTSHSEVFQAIQMSLGDFGVDNRDRGRGKPICET